MSCNPCFYSVKERFEIAQMMAWIPNCIYCMQNNYEPQYVVIAQTKEKTLKNWKKVLTFPWGFVIIILALSDRAKLIKSH